MPHERQARPVQRQPLAVVVSVRYVFAGVPVTEWYVHLRLTTGGAIYVVQDPARAGSALLTLAIDDLDVHERRLREGGYAASGLSDADAPRRLVVTDRDGNTLTFFKDPAG